MNNPKITKSITYKKFKEEVLNDYWTILISREASLLGRKEVLSGKAKFGIFGDGKELPQLAMAKVFEKGDFRSGYYRDQTFMLSINEISIQELFAALYADTNLINEPMSGGRQMGSHFSTKSINDDGSQRDLTKQYNSSSDISPTGGQMPRLLGLAMASKLYRTGKFNQNNFSINGNEIAWGTIGNASTSEGIFWESINAIGVHQVPAVVSVWDDNYGISVDNEYQTIKSSISEALAGFQKDENSNGYEILTVNGWDYPKLISTYEYANNICRKKHIPVLVHVKQLTQPIGHSTSGSHERYKSVGRLKWEKKYDCNLMMRKWILKNGISDEESLIKLENKAKTFVKTQKDQAWNDFQTQIKKERESFLSTLKEVIKVNNSNELINIYNLLTKIKDPTRKDILSEARKSIRLSNINLSSKLKHWILNYKDKTQPFYSSHLYNEYSHSLKNSKEIKPYYSEKSSLTDGRIILRNNFDKLFEIHPNLIVFGEDSGKIGGVNQGLEGLQEKYGTEKVDDRGIREATIIGEGIGLSLRGFRPIAEIQYLDYLIFAIQGLSDDLATMSYRTVGKQLAPLIVRTRGHRLEGIWHAGSPMGMLINSLRGVNLLVPRNMVQASGMYNALMNSFEPGIVIEPLNSYRLKERQPDNLGEFQLKIGKVEFIKKGIDITVVSYGSTLRIVEKASVILEKHDISIELIDLQTLIPFDIDNEISQSIEKTNKLLIIDEDYPGGASSYILNKVLNEQDAFKFLDSKPETLTAKEHRPPYGTDGDYYSKPSIDDVFEKIYKIMKEYNPDKYKLDLG
ncbi:MAG: transketolase [Flavobacteriales bacterium]|nr:MAG: transketolase [Flavobacteriales bacterium]